jgi:hypothetical protein
MQCAEASALKRWVPVGPNRSLSVDTDWFFVSASGGRAHGGPTVRAWQCQAGPLNLSDSESNAIAAISKLFYSEVQGSSWPQHRPPGQPKLRATVTARRPGLAAAGLQVKPWHRGTQARVRRPRKAQRTARAPCLILLGESPSVLP